MKVTGDKKVIGKLKRLDKKVQTKGQNQALRKGAKLILTADKSEMAEHSQTGKAAKSLKIRSMKRKKDRRGINVGWDDKNFAGNKWYATFIEFGTKKSKGGKRKHRKRDETDNGEWRIEPRNIKKKAFDATKQSACTTVEKELHNFVMQAAKGG